MNLNLHILKDELAELSFTGVIHTEPWDFPIAHPYLYDDSTLQASPAAVYITEAEHMPETSWAGLPLCILCIGKPDHLWLEGNCSLIYTESSISVTRLLNLVIEVFRKYQLLEQQFDSAVENRCTLRELGELIMPFINNPIFLSGSLFQCIFQIFPEKLQTLTPRQKEYLENIR